MSFTHEHHCKLPKEQDNIRDQIENSFKKYLVVDSTCHLAQQTLKSKAAIDSEILRQISFFPKTINPFSRLRKYWEYIMIVALLVFFIVMPYSIIYVFGSNEQLNSFTGITELVLGERLNFYILFT